MRHLLPLTLCTLVVAGAVYAADSGHHSYIHQLTVQNAKTVAAKAKASIQAKLAAHKQAEAAEAKMSSLEKQCQDYIVAYNLLTVSQKSHVVKPDCSVQ